VQLAEKQSIGRAGKLIYWICFGIFVLNDFIFIAIGPKESVYFFDYGFRLAFLLLLFAVYKKSGKNLYSFLEDLYIVPKIPRNYNKDC
jgi:hypothetical protein